MNAPFRPCGDYYSTGQDEWLCDDCGADQFTCVCEDEVEVCDDCGKPMVGVGEFCTCDDGEEDALALAPVTRVSPTRIGA